MIDPYSIKEQKVLDFFRHSASIDEHARAYAYMNCITLRDYTNSDEFVNCTEPHYIILDSDNDSSYRGDIISWTEIEKYIDNMLLNGFEDDIECLYCYLTDKY